MLEAKPDLSKLSRREKELLYIRLKERVRRYEHKKIESFYPETGPLSRHNYPKHMEFFRAGKKFRERGAMAANRIGKTEGMGGYELTCHLTGIYPDWWEGYRFTGPIKAWASGTTNQTTRDILQHKLLGPISDIGTGLIPHDCILDYKRKAGGIPDAIETVFIQHVTGGVSVLGFKSYEQGRKAFEGVEQDVILLDEEPPDDVYNECLIRIMTTGGMIMLTFTPLQGVSEVVKKFMPDGKLPGPHDQVMRFVIQATWDDAPHLSEKEKKERWASLPPHQRDARSKGIPQLGSGAIYPLLEDYIVIDDFPIPPYWSRAYGFDVGWNCTAAAWGATDRDTGTSYIYSVYKKGLSEPPVHVQAIKSRGKWIPGVADPGARASSQRDGEKLMDEYVDLGLELSPADNAREAGIFDVFVALSTGKLKVFRSCAPWFEEFRLYRRDKNGKVVKENDHLMDCTRYYVRSGIDIAIQMPIEIMQQKILIPGNPYDPMKFGMNKEEDGSYDPLKYGMEA